MQQGHADERLAHSAAVGSSSMKTAKLGTVLGSRGAHADERLAHSAAVGSTSMKTAKLGTVLGSRGASKQSHLSAQVGDQVGPWALARRRGSWGWAWGRSGPRCRSRCRRLSSCPGCSLRTRRHTSLQLSSPVGARACDGLLADASALAAARAPSPPARELIQPACRACRLFVL